MNILAFDTSSSDCSVALYVEDEHGGTPSQTTSVNVQALKQHTSVILPMIQSFLEKANLTFADLDAIAFGCGPGSFTGIRIAASLAQGIAYANSLPVIPVSSLAAAAQAAYLQHGWERLLVAVDARMGEIYWGVYQVENNIVLPVMSDILATADTIPAIPPGEWCGIGDAWGAYCSELTARIGKQLTDTAKDQGPTAEAVLCLAKERFKKGDWVDAADALPVYLR